MANILFLSLTIFIAALTFVAIYFSALTFHSDLVDEANFVKTMYFNWGSQHSSFLDSGDDATLVLDQTSGSGIESKMSFLFGSFEMLIKLVPGNSAGTVTAYYLSSNGEKHDEIDFEFLGNKSGQPYIIHTNIYTDGGGGREQQFYPWFDPSEDYHNYTIHWNPSQVVWYVDSIPIRVYRNYQGEGIPYPNQKPMRVYSSLWNADSWATRGGLDKIDWTQSPFVAKLRRFRSRACAYNGPTDTAQCGAPTPENWWSSAVYSYLNVDQRRQMNWARSNYLIYDYCKNIKQFNGFLPGECLKVQY
ncbi:hypothetical protein ACP275_11G050600 [Erythranthe tilingii]